MIQKLLLIIRLLFLKSFDSFSGKSFNPGVKLLCFGMFLIMISANAATYYSRQNGNWNDVNTWSTTSGGASAGAIPVAADNVILESGHSITVTANAAARSILFNSTNNILTVNAGFVLNIASGGNITMDSSNSNSRVATLTGGGTINTPLLNVGTNANPNTSDITTVLTSTISNLNITGNLSVISRRNAASNNASFNLASGIVNIDGQITTVNQTGSISTFSMATGVQSATLLLGNLAPFGGLSSNGTNIIDLNGLSSTVNYDRANNQDIYATTYNNLISSGSGNKNVLGNITVNKDFTLTGGTFILNNATSYIFRILGNYSQTTGSILDFNGGTSGVSNMYVAGNFTNNAAAGSITTIGAVQNGIINFNGTGIQTLNMPTVGAAIWTKYIVDTGSTLRLLSNLTLNRANTPGQEAWVGDVTVNGTIDFGTFQVSANGGTNPGNAGFIINTGAFAITANTGGLNGSVSATNLTRTFSTGANYVFNGTAAQVTAGMPATVNSLSINNTSGVSLSQATTITNDFSLSGGSTANLGTGLTHTAKTITLNGNGQNSGSWGGTNSAATNRSALYFGTTANGIVNVANSSCTTGYWTGITSTDWNTSSNWCGSVPGSATDVIIPSGTPFQPTIGLFVANVRNLTINSGATLTLSTGTSALNINGNFVNSGTLTTTAGSNIAIAGTALTQSIAGLTTLGTISLTKTAGVATFTGAVNANALTINGTGGTLNMGAALTHTFTGDITLTNGTLNGGSSTINANSSTATAWTGTGTNFTAGTSTVNFGGVAQTIATATTFNNLILSGTGAKTLSGAVTAANLTVTVITATNNSNLTVSTALSGTGTLINAAGNNLTLGGTSTINTLTTTAAGNTVTYNGTAQTIVGNAYSNLSLSNSGIKTLSAATTINGNLSVATGVSLVTSNFGLTLGGNFTNSGTINAGSSSVTITGSTAQNIAGFSTTGAIAVTKSTGVASFTSSVSTTGNFAISSGAVVNLGSILTHTAGSLTLNTNGQNGGTWGGSAATTAASKSALYFGSTATGILTVNAASCTAGYWTGITSTDWNTASNWCGSTLPTSATNVVIPAGTPFMPTIAAGTTALANNLTINTSASLTLSNAATSVLNLNGDFVNTGTFSAGAASIVNLVGTTQSISGGTYGNVTISGGTKTFTTNTIITNNLTLNAGAVLNLNGITTHSTGSLTLGSIIAQSGFWGSSSSTAVNISDEYFTATAGMVNVAGCASAPTVYNVSGAGGSFCSSSSGSTIGLSNSQTGRTYQVLRGTSPVGTAIPGTGSAMTFGPYNGTGVYTILATNTATSCSSLMSGSVTIYKFSSPPVPTSTAVTDVSCPGDATGSITISNAIAPASVAFLSANNQGIDLNASLLSNRGAFTIEGWIKFDKTKYISRMSLFGQNDVVEIGFEGDNLRFYTQYGTIDFALTSFPSDNGWHHIAATADNSSRRIYIDGTLRVTGNSGATNYGNSSFTTKMGFGVMDNAGVGFTGDMFKLGVWNRALSAGEITNLASGFVEYDASLSGLLAGYSFNESTGNSVAGVGSAATTATLIGTPTPTRTDPYTYSWTSVPAGFTSSSRSITGLTNRTYNLVTSLTTSVSSPINCTSFGSFTINATNSTTTITAQSTATQTKCIGEAFSPITVTATGTALNYQWYRVNTAAVTGGISLGTTNGANTNSYTPQSTAATTVYYYCVVSGTCGSATTSASGAFITNALPATPTIGTITGIGCSTLGSVNLSGLPSSGSWTINQTGQATASYTNTTTPQTSLTVTGLALGTYYFTVSNGTCTSVQSAPVEIKDETSTTWNGTTWLGGLPSATKNLIVSSVTPNQPFTADTAGCSLTINTGVTVTVPTGVTLTITNAVNTNGQLVFANNSSLMQSNSATTNSNTGSITYNRIAPKLLFGDFVYWSSPVASQTLFNLSPGTQADMFFYNNAPGWIEINSSNPMLIGKGYIIRAPQSTSPVTKTDYPASFIGIPNNGTYSTESLTSGRYHLIGNPYPSALSIDALIAGNTVLNGTIYLWTHNTTVNPTGNYDYNQADYASYNTTGSVKGVIAATGNQSNASERPTGFVGAGQSFFVSTRLPGPVVFRNTMRAGGTNNSQFFKSTSKENGIEKNRVWLNMISATGPAKQLLVGYIEGATNAYENRFDGVSFDGNPYLDFYSMINANKFVIQGRALPFVDTDVVPLGYRTTLKDTFTIAIDEVDGSLTNQKIYIEDKKTGEIHDLTTSNYTFTTEAGTFTDRFVLRYTGKTLGTGDFENQENGILVSVKNKDVSILSSKENIKEVNIYDISGKLIYTKKKVGNTELQIQNLPVGYQVLLVKVTLDNDFTTTRKIVLQ